MTNNPDNTYQSCTLADPQSNEIGLTISIPLEKVNVALVNNFLRAQYTLIKKALGIKDLPIEITKEALLFPWFSTMPEPERLKAYAQLVTALCKASKTRKRVDPTRIRTDNMKDVFRAFLVQIGFTGEEYKASRKFLLGNLRNHTPIMNNEIFEQALANGNADGTINPMLLCSYSSSKKAGNYCIDISDVNYCDIEAFATGLKAAGMTEFTISSAYSNLITALAAFETLGWRVVGLTQVYAPELDWDTGEHLPHPAIKMAIR